MTHDFPQNIEQYLTESGFSPTEILILRKLMEDQSLTLREIAFKAGKSTGVLDQAMKKLVRKKIVSRDMINETPKYTLLSFDAIATWVKREAQQQREILKRKQENFESFISSLKADHARPEMQHFTGLEGLQQAYKKLLEVGEQLQCYKAIAVKEEEDPLKDFYVQFFRERHRRSIFLRTIAPNSPLARRYKSRDAFEYRETILREEGEQPPFEKIICGDVIACIDHEKQAASFIRYPELAETERAHFENEWARLKKLNIESAGPKEFKKEIDPATKALSSLRDFFMSRKSIAVITIFALLSAGITYGMYLQNYSLNLQRVREEVKAIAATAAPNFTIADIALIHDSKDINTPAFQRITAQLIGIRNSNPSVVATYIIRPIGSGSFVEFVVDPDVLSPPGTDITGDGIVDNADQVLQPGELYNLTQDTKYFQEVLVQPTADKKPFIDKWGIWISGFAPIQDENKNTVAILGVDRNASDIRDLTNDSFTPIYTFAIIFLFFLIIRVIAFHKSIVKAIIFSFKNKKIMRGLMGAAIFMTIITYSLYLHTKNLMINQIAERLISIATLAANEIDVNDLDELHIAKDILRPQYRKIFDQLNRIREQNEEIKYIYVLRPTDDQTIWEFVVDADSIDINSLYDSGDLNLDEKINEADENVAPGVMYYNPGISDSLKQTIIQKNYQDQWGNWISGHAPIRNTSGEVKAIIGIDIEITTLLINIRQQFLPIFILLSVTIFSFIFYIIILIFKK